MSQRSTLALSRQTFRGLRAHLLQPDSDIEQAAFGFAKEIRDGEGSRFQLVEWRPVPPDGFKVQTAYHFELTDETQASAIKRAHDLGACLIEFHCHTGRWPAAFSQSDRLGFFEFVPHAMWRLKGRPYVAVVLVPSGHDGLVWSENPHSPRRLDGLLVDGRLLPSTGLTSLSIDDLYE